MLPQDESVELDAVYEACDAVHGMLAKMPTGGPDLGALRHEVQARVVVWQDTSATLDDPTGHVEWLATAKMQRTWEFWERYRRYLEDVQLFPRRVVWRLDETTDRVLQKLEAPDRDGPWDRRGLVVGEVQSGK